MMFYVLDCRISEPILAIGMDMMLAFPHNAYGVMGALGISWTIEHIQAIVFQLRSGCLRSNYPNTLLYHIYQISSLCSGKKIGIGIPRKARTPHQATF
jgi:hypothetical protein